MMMHALDLILTVLMVHAFHQNSRIQMFELMARSGAQPKVAVLNGKVNLVTQFALNQRMQTK